MWEDGKVNVVPGKALCVLGHSELVEPVPNLRTSIEHHKSDHAAGFRWGCAVFANQ
jgi:hypothetical protein